MRFSFGAEERTKSNNTQVDKLSETKPIKIDQPWIFMGPVAVGFSLSDR